MYKIKIDKLGPNTYEGRVVCMLGRSRLWSETTKLLRIRRKDAHQDAVLLAQEIHIRNRS
jgi:hypothetical protein